MQDEERLAEVLDIDHVIFASGNYKIARLHTSNGKVRVSNHHVIHVDRFDQSPGSVTSLPEQVYESIQAVKNYPERRVKLSTQNYQDFANRVDSQSGVFLFYPARNLSYFIDGLPSRKSLNLNLIGLISIAMVLCSFVLPFVLGSWWWLLLFIAGVFLWKGNRWNMGVYILEELARSETFFETVTQSRIASGILTGHCIGDQIFLLDT